MSANLNSICTASAARKAAEAHWRQEILAAHNAGISYRDIAPAAGVSHQRVAQIIAEINERTAEQNQEYDLP